MTFDQLKARLAANPVLAELDFYEEVPTDPPPGGYLVVKPTNPLGLVRPSNPCGDEQRLTLTMVNAGCAFQQVKDVTEVLRSTIDQQTFDGRSYLVTYVDCFRASDYLTTFGIIRVRTRPVPCVAPHRDSYTSLHVEAALCVWEYMLQVAADYHRESAALPNFAGFDAVYENHGSAFMRDVAQRLGPWVCEALESIPEATRDTLGSYDWEVVPALVRTIVWDANNTTEQPFTLLHPAEAGRVITAELRQEAA